jgi:TolA-binding protein
VAKTPGLLLALALALPPGPARAAPAAPRGAGPDAALAGTLGGPAAAPARRDAPALEFERFRYAVEGQVSSKRREEIADLEQLLRLGGSEAETPGWLFRLAELHWEEAQYLFFEANRRDDELARDPGAAARLRAEKAGLEQRSRAEQERAIHRYREIVRRHPRWERLDEVLFFLGENLWKQRQRPEALKAYKALLTRFPRSRFVPDAWIAFGESFFDAAENGDRVGNLRKALEAYRRAAAFRDSAVAGFAIYKQAWVHYNLGEWQRALDLFREVIAANGTAGVPDRIDKRLALAREARKDFVRTYVHEGSPRAAAEEFARAAGAEHARTMLRQLADLYWETGKDREAILVYHRLIEGEPGAAEAPLLQARIVTAAGRLGRKDLAVAQARRFAEVLKAAEAGRDGGEEGRRALEAARADAENTLRTLAVQFHAEWRKSRDPGTAGHAEAVYREYLALFPGAKHARDLRFFHAELLFALERWQEAGDEYTRVADVGEALARDPAGAPVKHVAEALEGAVLAYAAIVKREGGAAPAAPGTAPAAGQGPMPAARRQLVEACERYLRALPRGEKAVEIAYQAAQAYYAHDQLAEAERLFTGIALEHPRHDLARFSANLALDSLNLRKDWRGMNALARRFWETEPLLRAHPELREDLRRVVEQSAFKLVEELQRGGRGVEAAEAYLAFASDWPQSKLAPTALHNSAVALAAARELERAIAVREQLTARHPGHPLAAKALAANAQDWAATADFERAADAWERYFAGWQRQAAAKAKPRRASPAARPAGKAADRGAEGGAEGPGFEEQVARDGLLDAGVLREGLGQLRKAEQDRLAFLAAWPRAPEAPKVALSLADLAGRQGNAAAELKRLRDYQREHAKALDEWLAVQHRIARLLERRGDAAGAARAWAEAGARARGRKVGERGMPALAQARYLALEPAYRDYERIALGGDARRLRAGVERKARRLEELQRAYTEVVKLEAPEAAVCALGRIGHAYRRFAATLQATPVPREIRREAGLVAEYRRQLATFAEAPERKGIEGLELAVAKARELGVENACAKDAAAALSKAGRGAEPLEEPLPGLAAAAAEEDPDAAWRAGRAALARDPADRGALARLMRSALARGRPALAQLVALRAAKVAAGDPELTFLRGRAHAAERDPARARADWLEAAGRGHAGARRELLRAALAARQWEAAAEHARLLAAAEPKDAEVALALGIAERHAGRPDAALAAYARAEELAKGALPEVHLARSVLLARVKGDCEAARAEARRYEAAAGPAPDERGALRAVRECAARDGADAVPGGAAALPAGTRAEARPAATAPASRAVPSR